jgi:hypothetical protein
LLLTATALLIGHLLARATPCLVSPTERVAATSTRSPSIAEAKKPHFNGETAMKTRPCVRIVAMLALLFATPALTSLAGPPHGEGVRQARKTTTLSGKVASIQGNQTVDIQNENGILYHVHFASRFAQAIQRGRMRPVNMLMKGQIVSVTGRIRGNTVWADRMEVQ